MKLSTFLTLALPTLLHACPQDSLLHKRSTDPTPKYDYSASQNWHTLSASYKTCRTGTHQSPISLSSTQGSCHKHNPTFTNYTNIPGNFKTWGFGPAFSLSQDAIGENPKLSWDEEDAYLIGWHVHAPSDHLIDGHKAKAEIHLVHSSLAGHEKAVVSILLDAGNTPSAFFSSLPTYILPNATHQVPGNVNLDLLLRDVGYLDEFWSYIGSLTSPPCAEGIRWFVARRVLLVGVEQMQRILEASLFSSRVEQQVWLHGVNE